ncbi:MAG: GGDEF domain-containing protein [Campylobacterales bacterium]|nr:GGDEF domain-containing protein [Campylobacterales bacterium]
MQQFKLLNQLLPFEDKAFEAFYDTMLNDVRLSVFFENDEQIVSLIKKQKAHFHASLTMDKEVLKQSYIRLGEYHYNLRIPYVDFIKGTDILEEYFLIHSQKYLSSVELMDEIFGYFKIMKSYTAKGYLNKMLEEDKKDIESFFEQTSHSNDTYLPKAIVSEKIKWLKDMLYAIENDGDFSIGENQTLLQEWLQEMSFLSLEKRNFFEDLERRIFLNTQNLFYFLKKEEYLEILPLYTSLLSIYKLTLMMNNAITIEYANKIIDDMKLDSLTQLFRKDIFEEILKKEIAYAKRNDGYYTSVVYIDLDNFKGINDNFGHYSGDKVIEKMGEVIRNNIRSGDMGFRIGGDEFAIIFRDATKQQAKNVSQKIKVDFTSYEFIFNEDVTFSVGISMGISDFSNSSEDDMSALIKSVDAKLCEAKNRGKNQICL